MSRRGLPRRVPTVGLAVIAVLGWAGCGRAGSEPVAAPVQIAPTAPDAPLIPGALPEGFLVEGVSAGGTADPRTDRALLIGAPDPDTGPPSGPAIVVGESSGSASIAGPSSGPGETVPNLGIAGSFDPYITEDGAWTWVVFNDDPGCIEDCLDFVAGRGVPDDELIAVARGTDYEDAGPVVDPGSLPDGMAPLVSAVPADGVLTSSGARITLRSADGSAMITVQQVHAAAELASLWSFWIDDPDGTPIRGQPGWAGRVGGTYEGGDHGRLWIEDGTIVAVIGWDVSDAVLDQVIEGLRPGTPDELAALGDDVVARAPTPDDTMCGSAVLSGPVGDARWVVGLGTGGGGDPDAFEVCAELVTSSGPAAGTGGGNATLAPVGSLTVGAMQVSGGPIDGTFIYGASPPGTAAVELAAVDGTVHALQLSDTGPREQGERWFATFEPALVGGETVIARAQDGSVLAQAPAGN
jgi:hypothetical protein